MKSVSRVAILLTLLGFVDCVYAHETNICSLESWRVEAIDEEQRCYLFSLNAVSPELPFSFHLAESNKNDERLREILLVSGQNDWWGCLLLTTNGLENVALTTLSSNHFAKCLKEYSSCIGVGKKVDFNISQHIMQDRLSSVVSLRNQRLFIVGECPIFMPQEKSSLHRCVIIPLCQSQKAMLLNSANRGRYYDVACVCSEIDTYEEIGYMLTPSRNWRQYKSQINANGAITATIINENGKE